MFVAEQTKDKRTVECIIYIYILSLKLIKFTLTVFWSLVRKPGYKGEENSGYSCGWNFKKGAVGTQ